MGIESNEWSDYYLYCYRNDDSADISGFILFTPSKSLAIFVIF